MILWYFLIHNMFNMFRPVVRPSSGWWNKNTIAVKCVAINLTYIGPCIANVFADYNQKDATFDNFFIYVKRSTCFRRFFRPSSGAQNCTFSVRYMWDHYCYLPLAWLGWDIPARLTALTFWRRNYFFFNFSTPCILNVNNTGTKYVRIMKRTAFWKKNGEYIPCLKYSVPIFVE